MLSSFSVKTRQRTEFVDITRDVQACVAKAGVQSGLCWVFVPHTTAGVTINENADPDVCRDITRHLAELVPQRSGFAHAEGNSDAHIKASMMGFSQALIVENGRLHLGTWQGVYFCEFDGPRTRKVHVKTIQA
jgi:secondary thiamine-phosphate synthase enzyme